MIGTRLLPFSIAPALALALVPVAAQSNTVPDVEAVFAVQNSVTRLVEVTYDLYDADGDLMTVSLWLSEDGGQTFSVRCRAVSGDIGAGIGNGNGKRIVWDALADYPGHVGEYQVKVEADEGHATSGPGFSRVSAGQFVMGDGEAACGTDERTVTLTRAFNLGRTEVTNLQYASALQWAYDQGHVIVTTRAVHDSMDGSTVELLDLDDFECEISFAGGIFQPDPGKAEHPVIELTWYGAAAYCDWLSLISLLPRAYDHSTWICNAGDPYGAAGYRLPTDAEWEYAAQFDDERAYPWGGEAPDCSRANCYGCEGWTVPVGSYPPAPGALGLSDMAGNVSEWCDDAHSCHLGTSAEQDPSRSQGSGLRVCRGGSYTGGAIHMRCASRFGIYQDLSYPYIGFRVARTEVVGYGISPQFLLDTRDVVRVEGPDSPGERNSGSIATGIEFQRTFPEPMGSSVSIDFNLVHPGAVSVRILDATGRLVRSLAEDLPCSAGEHRIFWDGKDRNGLDAPGGAYFIQVATKDRADSRRVTLVR